MANYEYRPELDENSPHFIDSHAFDLVRLYFALTIISRELLNADTLNLPVSDFPSRLPSQS
jgi:hypothetical protein